MTIKKIALGLGLALLLGSAPGPERGLDTVAGHLGLGVRGVAAQGGSPQQILDLVNGLRSSYGLPPFAGNNVLAVAAQNQANWMASTALYSHTGASGSTPASRAAAAGYQGVVSENIVGGTELTPRQGVIWWQNSGVHLNTMISTRYTQAGVGFAQGHDQNFYVLVVGNPGIAASPAAAAETGPEPIFVTPIEISAPREDGSIVHTVQPGQTAWAIAARYEVGLVELMQLNNLKEGHFLQPGDEIIVRLAEGVPTPTPPASHVVAAGESAWTIAALYELSLADLYWYNNLTEDSILHAGDELIIRLAEGQSPPPTPTPQMSHIVQSGETAWTIAAIYGLDLADLLAYNNLDEQSILQPGDELQIRPSPTPTPTPEATPTPAATPAPPASPTPPATTTPAQEIAEVPAETAAPEPAGPDWGQIILTATAVIVIGLVGVAAVVAVIVLRGGGNGR